MVTQELSKEGTSSHHPFHRQLKTKKHVTLVLLADWLREERCSLIGRGGARVTTRVVQSANTAGPLSSTRADTLPNETQAERLANQKPATTPRDTISTNQVAVCLQTVC